MKMMLALVLSILAAAPPNDEQILPRRPLRPIMPAPVRPSRQPITSVIAGKEYDGRRITVDMPDHLYLENSVGTDRLGLCVYTSAENCAQFQNVVPIIGFRDFMKNYAPHGGSPRKLAEWLAKKTTEPLSYLQDTSANRVLFRKIMDTRRAVAMTYGYSHRYISFVNLTGEVDHMVTCVYLDDEYMAVADNNFPGTFEWMPAEEGFRRWEMRGGGWLFAFRNPPPPPKPIAKD
jgi:hypothetical protein